MKKFFTVLFIIFLLVLVVWIVLTVLHVFPITSVAVTDEPIIIEESLYNSANYRQYEANVHMMEHDGKLYIYRYPSDELLAVDKYTNCLSVFETGKIRRIKEFDNIIFMSDGYVYYCENDTLCCYSVTDNSISKISLKDSTPYRRGIFCEEDGTVFFPQDNNFTEYAAVKKNNLSDSYDFCEDYTLKSGTYRVEGTTYGNQDIVFYNKSSEKQSLDLPYGKKSLIHCKDGLLVYNEGHGNLLYYIDGNTGDVVSLFTIECMASVSSVNVYCDYVYLSFMRYEKHGEFGMLRYENDAIEGTYRIDLRNCSSEKISDKIYNGLYIFDDTGIYACDERSNIYKLDFDGSVICTLIK